MAKATVDQVKAHYVDQGFEVRVSDDGHVEFSPDGADWREGRYVGEYLVDDRGSVHLS